MATIPTLERHCNSWIVVHPKTGGALCETYSRTKAQDCADHGLEVLTAAQWLARVNTKATA